MTKSAYYMIFHSGNKSLFPMFNSLFLDLGFIFAFLLNNFQFQRWTQRGLGWRDNCSPWCPNEKNEKCSESAPVDAPVVDKTQ